jgi:hypothetical protein
MHVQANRVHVHHVDYMCMLQHGTNWQGVSGTHAWDSPQTSQDTLERSWVEAPGHPGPVQKIGFEVAKVAKRCGMRVKANRGHVHVDYVYALRKLQDFTKYFGPVMGRGPRAPECCAKAGFASVWGSGSFGGTGPMTH